MIEITAAYLASQGLSENFPQRFWSKVKKTDSCWLWTACTCKMGYGYINGGFNKKVMIAPRASWILNRGPIPRGMCVLHNCPGGDNPMCVNPDHLWIGTRPDNMRDKIKKGRQPQGELVGGHKLTRGAVVYARQMWETGSYTIQDIADEFGVSLSAMFNVVRRRTWRTVP